MGIYAAASYPENSISTMPDVGCELDVSSYPGGFGWGLWQRQNGKSITVYFKVFIVISVNIQC